ncbi:MAG TPA: CPBP family glutamic-type intramembrane protease [Methylomirabilota bacterium]|nr:CPBP family glutamic-type intramembrane protease [Methylomirabilota bacterium]
MYAITRAWQPRPARLWDDVPAPLLAGLGVVAGGSAALAASGLLPPWLARALGAGAAQGALLATAVAWSAARGPERPPAPMLAAALTMFGALGAAAHPLGAVAYAATPLWLWRQRARLPGFGLRTPPPALVAAGAVLGAALGVHLLLTASFTLGYGMRVPPAPELARWVAYDAGANVLATEAFFRGALFDRAQRRWSFAVAATVTTAASVVRYLVDPLLPRTLEVAAGAIFYLTLLGIGTCWLYWRSGSIVPGVAAGLGFFAAYRLLHVIR